MPNMLLDKIFKEHYVIAAIPVVLSSFALLVIGACFGQQIWIVLLFSVPLGVQIVGWWKLHKRLDADNQERFSKLIFYWFYVVTMTVCLVFYCGLWCFYLVLNSHYHWEDKAGWVNGYDSMSQGGWEGYVNLVSGLALLFILFLLAAVIRMTHAIMKGAPTVVKDAPDELTWRDLWSLDCLRCGAAQEPFWTLMFFFTVFLSVSYLFGLAFAFHDKSYPPNRPALYMKNLPEPSLQFKANDLVNPGDLARKLRERNDRVSIYLTGQLLPETQQLLAVYDDAKPNEPLTSALVKELDRALRDEDLYSDERFKQTPLDEETRRLAMEYTQSENAAEQDIHRLNRALLEQAYPNAIAKSRSEPFPFRFSKSSPLLITDEEQEQQQPEMLTSELIKENKSKLEGLISEVKKATEESCRARIVVTGYADDANLKAAAYKSNYELAEARALNVRSMILNGLSSNGYDKWRNIEWEFLPRPNERKDGRRAAEVYIERIPEEPASLLMPYLKAEHANPLNLLDYVYFANYTITTTGYGDIIPSTGYARFICSFANICEVFFLVVFFNALLSLRKGGDQLHEARELRELRKERSLLSPVPVGVKPQSPPPVENPSEAEQNVEPEEPEGNSS